MPTVKHPWRNGMPCWADCAFAAEHRGMHHARDFYGKLFGWHLVDGAEGTGYTVCLKDEQPVAGLRRKMRDDEPTVWVTYLATDDVEATAARVTASGGTVVAEPAQVPRMGSLAYCTDPTGALFGLWHGGDLPGWGLVGDPGSVAHSSLLTRDLTGSKTFYANVFGYTYTGESQDGATALVDGKPAATLHLATRLPDDAPPSWLVHFAVADRDSGAQLAQELDAEILMTLDTPAGREAVLQGRYGEIFNVLEPAD